MDYTTQTILVALDAAGTLLAVDAFGAAARQPYPLTISAINRPPYFTTPPRTWAAAAALYYHVGAEDPQQRAIRVGPGPLAPRSTRRRALDLDAGAEGPST